MVFPTEPLQIVDSPARWDHFSPGRTGPISVIVIHATAGRDSLDWLTWQSPAGKEVSIHRLIQKDGTIIKIVPDNATAYHAGPSQRWQSVQSIDYNMNSVSLGIELENLNTVDDRYPTAQLMSCGGQVVEWWGLYGFLPVVFHYEIQANKTDPRYLTRASLSKFIMDALRASI